MYIDGFGISQYRSFGKDIQRIGPLERINFFIGQNNSGKSNILLFIKNQFSLIVRGEPPEYVEYDRHYGENTGEIDFEIGVKLTSRNYEKIIEQLIRITKNNNIEDIFSSVFTAETLTKGTNVSWFRYNGRYNGPLRLSNEMIREIISDQITSNNFWLRKWQILHPGARGGTLEQNWVPGVLEALSPKQLTLPEVEIIPAIRKIGEAGTELKGNDGSGIIEQLAKLQNPNLTQPKDRDQFEKINHFLQTVTGNSSAILDIPHDRKMIIVHMDNKSLPLSSLGTGIHEVIILAAAATVNQNKILCLEEPELHLHPSLQKQLILYLCKETNNQYFISTHSAHLLDTPGAAIFHVRLENSQTKVENVVTDSEKSSICDDLGYKASDLMQANCIIWVEGPSDRIYLNHWIRSMNSDLIGGLHYSIMFYGGRLLNHLSANDPEVDDFISLRRMNRHIAIIMDRDKSNGNDEINDTKRRLRDEFSDGNGFAWVTEGREIENYIEPTVLENAIKGVHPRAVETKNVTKFSKSMKYYVDEDRKARDADKVKVAKKVVESEPIFDRLDLEDKMKSIISFIEESNK